MTDRDPKLAELLRAYNVAQAEYMKMWTAPDLTHSALTERLSASLDAIHAHFNATRTLPPHCEPGNECEHVSQSTSQNKIPYQHAP